MQGTYHFYQEDEILAGRTLSHAARVCLEMGLHRRERVLALFPASKEQSLAVRIFWSIYVLDRRWSIGNDIPFVIQDADIDSLLPEPVSKIQI